MIKECDEKYHVADLLVVARITDEDRLDDVYISEMLPSKQGWNNPFLEDEIIRGYTDEMRDFMEAVYYNRPPKSGFDIAYDSTKIIYAAYKSAELGRAVGVE